MFNSKEDDDRLWVRPLDAQTVHIEPPMQDIFKALEIVNPVDVKVVILGQNPTPQNSRATGVAFRVDEPPTVPSALNVLMEVCAQKIGQPKYRSNLKRPSYLYAGSINIISSQTLRF